MMRRSLVLGVVLLLIIVIIIPSVPSEQLTIGDIIIVDDEGDGDYTSISEALNNSNPGDTIEVYSGTYTDSDMIIDKEGLTLIGISYELGSGNDTGKPFIDVQYKDVFRIYADGVSVINFFIFDNYLGQIYNYYVIYTRDCNDCIIENNTITAGDKESRMKAIWVVRGENYKIINNSIYGVGSAIDGIFSNVSIIGNTINDTKVGMKIEAQHSIIKRNKISKAGWGIYFKSSKYNVINRNIIENNDEGIYLPLPDTFGTQSTNNLFSQNNIINNSNQIYCEYYWFGRNKYDKNYWDDWIGFGPKLIFGLNSMFFFLAMFMGVYLGINISYRPIPWIQFDWHPASEPYDIEV